MALDVDIKHSIDRSVLCWLATVSADGIPNVSPKEIFTNYGDEQIIVANIASPQTVKNIKANSAVCISFIDILVQKGFQLKGHAEIVEPGDPEFNPMHVELEKMTEGKFPIVSIIKIKVESSKPIIAPRYLLYPDTTEAEQIERARKDYGL